MPFLSTPDEPWTRGKFVVGEGFYRSRGILAGRNPGEVERRIGQPFRGPAGNELNMYMLRSDLQRSDFYVSNLYKYATPEDEPPTQEQFSSHWPIFARELALVRPSILVTFGADCSKFFFNKCGIEWRDVESNRSMPIYVSLPIQSGLDVECENDLPEDEAGMDWLLNLMSMAPTESAPIDLILFPCTHPAAGIHQVSTMVTILDDFERLAATLAGQISPRAPTYLNKVSTQGRPFSSSALGVLSNPPAVKASFITDSTWVAIDTEGWKARVWGLTYSFDGATGYCIKTSTPEAVKTFNVCLLEFIAKGGRIAIHNTLYDLETLAAIGIHLPDGSYVDTMIMSYLLGRLPQGLKPLSYRFLGVSMNAYEDIVNPYRERYGRQYLEAAGSIDWCACRYCGAPNADLTEHPKGGAGAWPAEWFRKDGKTVRAKFVGQVEMCSNGILLRDVNVNKSGNAYFKRQMNINARIQRAWKDYELDVDEAVETELDVWEELVSGAAE